MQPVTIVNRELLCPHCNGSYLHHYTIVSYHREQEDEKNITLIEVQGGNVTLHNDDAVKNPSDRRDGAGIRFWCEQGCPEMELTIAQHKGSTYVQWRDAHESSSGPQE